MNDGYHVTVASLLQLSMFVEDGRPSEPAATDPNPLYDSSGCEKLSASTSRTGQQCHPVLSSRRCRMASQDCWVRNTGYCFPFTVVSALSLRILPRPRRCVAGGYRRLDRKGAESHRIHRGRSGFRHLYVMFV